MKLHKEWAEENQVKYLVWRMHWWKLEYDDRYDKFWIDILNFVGGETHPGQTMPWKL